MGILQGPGLQDCGCRFEGFRVIKGVPTLGAPFLWALYKTDIGSYLGSPYLGYGNPFMFFGCHPLLAALHPKPQKPETPKPSLGIFTGWAC